MTFTVWRRLARCGAVSSDAVSIACHCSNGGWLVDVPSVSLEMEQLEGECCVRLFDGQRYMTVFHEAVHCGGLLTSRIFAELRVSTARCSATFVLRGWFKDAATKFVCAFVHLCTTFVQTKTKKLHEVEKNIYTGRSSIGFFSSQLTG